jgi:hypothetical protein
MVIVIFSCGLLVALTTVIHYEVLRGLNTGLPSLTIPSRTKLLVVIFAALVAHGVEIGVYGAALFVLTKYMPTGPLRLPTPSGPNPRSA